MGRHAIPKEEPRRIVQALGNTMDDSQHRLAASGRYEYLSIDDISVDPEQVRKIELPEALFTDPDFDLTQLSKAQQALLDDIDELGRNIKQVGLLQPIVVYKVGATHLILAGERRYWAHRRAGLSQIQAIIRPKPKDEREKLVLQMTENIERENLSLQDYINGILTISEHTLEATGEPATYSDFMDIFGFKRAQAFRLQGIARCGRENMQPILELVIANRVNNLKIIDQYTSLKTAKERKAFIKKYAGAGTIKKSLPGRLTLKTNDYSVIVDLLKDLHQHNPDKYKYDPKTLTNKKSVQAIWSELIKQLESAHD